MSCAYSHAVQSFDDIITVRGVLGWQVAWIPRARFVCWRSHTISTEGQITVVCYDIDLASHGSLLLVSWHDCQGMGVMGTFSGLVSSTKKHRKSARKKYRKHCDTMGARPSIRWCSHNRYGFYYNLLQCCSLMLRVVQEHASDFPSIQTRIATYLASTWPNMTTLA